MLKFKGNHKTKDVIKNMKKLGYEIKDISLQLGFSDYLRFDNVKSKTYVMFNVFSGVFWVEKINENKIIATHQSNHLDSVDWYVDLLNAFYMKQEDK